MTRAAADVVNVKKASKPETRTALVRRARTVYRELGEVYPNAKCELDFETPFQLLTAVILSAQSTDVGVNKVTRRCSRGTRHGGHGRRRPRRAGSPDQADRLLPQQGQVPARHVPRRCATTTAGTVPGKLDELVKLPASAARTANVVLGDGLGFLATHGAYMPTSVCV